MQARRRRIAVAGAAALLAVGPVALAGSLLGRRAAQTPAPAAAAPATRAAQPARDGAAAVAAGVGSALPRAAEAGGPTADAGIPAASDALGAVRPTPSCVDPDACGAPDPREWPGAASFAAGPPLAEIAAAAEASAGVVAAAPIGVAPVLLLSGLPEPVFVTGIPGDERLFVVERAGRIRILENGALRPDAFLDIRSNVSAGANDERGLLGLAFDPDHPWNGRFYVYYTDTAGDSVLARYEVGGDPNRADPGSEEVLLQVDQPASNHNGGTVAFSPIDGFLYLGLGDGGGADDPQERAQNPAMLLGKMLRLDVGGAGSGYAIPPDNPFVGDAAVRDEIWALGLRNPFRFSFDWLTGDLWIGDVGQSAREEVDYEPAGSPGGLNYGWDVREGAIASPAGDDALPPYVNAPPFVDPIVDYAHVGAGCSGSVTGGIVYRGPLASIQGEYFFGDFCRGQIWSYHLASDTLTERTAELGAAASPFQIVAFGEDGFGAMIVVHIGGSLYRVGPGGSECDDGQDDDGDGAADLADTGCRDAADPSELDSSVACDDGYDNDSDGDIDFPADDDCQSSASNAERPAGDGGGGGGGDGGGCGLGVELVLLAPLLRRKTRSAGSA